MNNKLYIGQINFAPNESNIEFPVGNTGAFCNVIILAENQSDYKKIVRSDLEADDYVILSIKDIELFSDACSRVGFSRNLLEKSKSVSEFNKIVYGDVFTYSDD